ncbi:MAG: hypothetical protein ACM3MN_03655, partial [Nitrospirota bacterium]
MCCTLEAETPSLLRRLLGRVFSKVSFLESQQRLLADLEQQRAVLVYAVKYRRELDFLLLNHRLREAGLNAPDTAFDLRLLLWLPAWRSLGLLFGLLLYYLREGHLPNPYQTGFFRERIMRRHAAVLFLVGEGSYYRRVGFAEEDPLHLLIETQRQMDMPVVLVPSLIFHGKAPERHEKGLVDIFFGDKERPGRLRKL